MIGQNIRKRRIELGMTQEELAKKCGYTSKSSINKIELDKNDVSQSKLLVIAKALECEPTDLLTVNIQAERILPNQILVYAKKLSELSPNKQKNVMKFIDFMEKSGEDEE